MSSCASSLDDGLLFEDKINGITVYTKSLRAKAACLIENLTDAIKHFDGVIAMACTQGYAEQLEKPVSPRRERSGGR